MVGVDMSSHRATADPTAFLAVELGRWPLAPATVLLGLLAGAAVAAVGVVVGLPLTSLTPLPGDVSVLEATSVLTGPGLVRVSLALSYLGHILVVVPLCLALTLIARLRFGDYHLGLLLAVVVGGATAVTAVVKLVTDRARPDDALVTTFTSAFPSGHAVRAMALYGLVAWLVRAWARSTAVRRLALPTAVLLAALNGLARVALEAHWPSDVAAGLALGALWLTVALALVRPRPPTAALDATRTGPGPDRDVAANP